MQNIFIKSQPAAPFGILSSGRLTAIPKASPFHTSEFVLLEGKKTWLGCVRTYSTCYSRIFNHHHWPCDKLSWVSDILEIMKSISAHITLMQYIVYDWYYTTYISKCASIIIFVSVPKAILCQEFVMPPSVRFACQIIWFGTDWDGLSRMSILIYFKNPTHPNICVFGLCQRKLTWNEWSSVTESGAFSPNPPSCVL